MLLIFPAFLALGLFVPGFFLARALGLRLRWASAFVLSLPILFHAIFWAGVFHLPITMWTVLPILAAITGVAAWRKPPAGAPPGKLKNPLLAWSSDEKLLLALSAAVGAILLAQNALSPLNGFDAPFRWDFLAQRIFELNRFNFYPPLTPADFRAYFFVDGIPPMVSFARWWTYESAQQYLPSLTAIFVVAQFAAAAAFAYGAAAELYSRRAGVLAAAMLAASPLFFRSVLLGQETGLTALAVAATLYFIVAARPRDARLLVAAGLAAALCALSREYGWIAAVIGVIALLWRRRPLADTVLFAAVAGLAGAPWYIRNWIVAGNPVYSLKVASFAVNPIHDAIMRHYDRLLGVQHWTGGQWAGNIAPLLILATPQIFAGVPGLFRGIRERGYLLVAVALLTGVWLASIGFTSGGMPLRVLSPALVVLSITGAGLLEPAFGAARWRSLIVVGLVLCLGWTAAAGAVYPYNPADFAHWSENAFERITLGFEWQQRDEMLKRVPQGARILSDNAYLHAAFAAANVEVVPVWSPEVRFIFSDTPEEAGRKLQELGITRVAYYPNSLNTSYLTGASPFYAALPRLWTTVLDVPNYMRLFGAPGK